ncbi:amylo-alpha-1,6-glucosidase [Zafaria cholistanensis]|uniref:Amylo-alpha-1,6-glucosidase n=1 Tax=Zafaria cholistanensis TaxID=1682741 RepID=A0A5A7NLT3_9MICC|nr:glycogen debranching N-terminal domain-containing protein [Zafaria cholistanensis]GER21845.1 amylo-alpha-1,6-glucosidase [Zafaria cholistanensis]
MAVWSAEIGARDAGPGAVTLLAGTSFCISAANGDMDTRRPHGLFFRDTRFVSGWHLRVNGRSLESLSGMAGETYRATFVGRMAPAEGEEHSHLLVERHRHLDGGLRERIVVTNHSALPAQCHLHLAVEADFSDLFDVKEGRTRPVPGVEVRETDTGILFESVHGGQVRTVLVSDPQATAGGHHLAYRIDLPPQGTWSTEVRVTPRLDGVGPEEDAHATRYGALSLPEFRERAWRERVPQATYSYPPLARIMGTSRTDLGSLRIFDPDRPERVAVAAGSPWFMALFGRDAILSSFMSLPLDPSLAHGTIQTLAELQGTRVDPRSEEQPGKILHEVRLGASTLLALGGGRAYYGTVDATPLFVMLAGELTRWGFETDIMENLMPAVDRAMSWITDYGDSDGDGFVEYERANPEGLINQGWKDSWDGITFADGALASAPLALCEVQGYVYAAYVSRALMAGRVGDAELSALWASRAQRLKEEFNDRFWLPQKGYFALALDRDKVPVDSLASNMGHCLWSGIVDEEKAPLVAERLMARDMFSGWGVRTLSTRMGAYDPASYHNGSIWPHDNALIAAGLMRYGFIEESQRIAVALVEAAEAFGGRLPELFCGLDRSIQATPIPYPTSCSPQAWAAATPIHLMRVMLRLDPCLPTGELFLAPALPPEWGEVQVRNLPLGVSRVSLRASRDQAAVEGMPPEVALRQIPRKPLADLIDVLPRAR